MIRLTEYLLRDMRLDLGYMLLNSGISMQCLKPKTPYAPRYRVSTPTDHVDFLSPTKALDYYQSELDKLGVSRPPKIVNCTKVLHDKLTNSQ